MNGTGIQYITNQHIDRKKWDDLIAASPNGLVYAWSDYLDAMAPRWDALILGDYETVMPLPWNQKWGIRYLYQPPFTQQLGVFAKEKISDDVVAAFCGEVRRHFRFAEIFLNYANGLPGLTPCTNLTLSLHQPYRDLSKQYQNVLVKNLKRASHSSILYTSGLDLSNTLHTYTALYAHRIPHVKKKDFLHFERLCYLYQQRGELVLRGVTDKQSGLLATGLLLRKKKRIYLLQTATLKAGREKQASHFLLDRIIQEFSQQDLILDFEGSDIPGVRSFYTNFGGINQPYFFLRINRLPWPARLLKPRASAF